MNLRLKTSFSVETKLNELQSILQVSSKASIIRLAIAYSIKNTSNSLLSDFAVYDVKIQNGADYNRFTIFGDDELFYKLQMEQKMGKHLDDDEFFPSITNAHIECGIIKLYGEIKLMGSKEKFIRKFIDG